MVSPKESPSPCLVAAKTHKLIDGMWTRSNYHQAPQTSNITQSTTTTQAAVPGAPNPAIPAPGVVVAAPAANAAAAAAQPAGLGAAHQAVPPPNNNHWVCGNCGESNFVADVTCGHCDKQK